MSNEVTNTNTEDIGYYDYLGTRAKDSHRPIIVTGRYGRLRWARDYLRPHLQYNCVVHPILLIWNLDIWIFWWFSGYMDFSLINILWARVHHLTDLTCPTFPTCPTFNVVRPFAQRHTVKNQFRFWSHLIGRFEIKFHFQLPDTNLPTFPSTYKGLFDY